MSSSSSTALPNPNPNPNPILTLSQGLALNPNPNPKPCPQSLTLTLAHARTLTLTELPVMNPNFDPNRASVLEEDEDSKCSKAWSLLDTRGKRRGRSCRIQARCGYLDEDEEDEVLEVLGTRLRTLTHLSHA